jgi:hypothetical protein
VWTIDLVLLLHSLGLSLSYSTITVGVNPSHQAKRYYSADWAGDLLRVQQRFTTATSLSIPVHHSSIDVASFLSLLSTHPVLVLVNPAFLHCPACHTHSSLSPLSFTGHFIVCVGMERRKGIGGLTEVEMVRYMDPASDCVECVVGVQWLERARKADGTDEDVVVIQGRRTTQSSTSQLPSETGGGIHD